MCHFLPSLAASLVQDRAWRDRVQEWALPEARRAGEVTSWVPMMPLISGDVVSERSDISGRKFSTEGQTFAPKPKHTPVTAALIDDLSGKLVVVHHYATLTVRLKCSVRPLRFPFVPVEAEMLKPCEVERYERLYCWCTIFPIGERMFYRVVARFNNCLMQLRAQIHQNTEDNGEDTQGEDWLKVWWNVVIVAWRLLWRQEDFPHQEGPFSPSLSWHFFLPVSAEHFFLDHFQPQPPQLNF